MSDHHVRKAPSLSISAKSKNHKSTITGESTVDPIVEPHAESKRLDQTKLKYDLSKKTAQIKVGTKPIT